MKTAFTFYFLFFCWFASTTLSAQVDLSPQITAAKEKLEEAKVKYSEKHINYHKAALDYATLLYKNEDTEEEAYKLAYPALEFIHQKEGNSQLYQKALKRLPIINANVIHAKIQLKAAKKEYGVEHITFLKRYIDLAKAYHVSRKEYPYDDLLAIYQAIPNSTLVEKEEFYTYLDEKLPKFYTDFLKADVAYRVAKKKGKESVEFAEELINFTKLSFKNQDNDDFDFDFDVNYQELFDAGEVALSNSNEALYQRILETINLSEDMAILYPAQKAYIDVLRTNKPINDTLIIKLRQFIAADLSLFSLHPYFYEDACQEIYDSIASKLGEESNYYKIVKAICEREYETGSDDSERILEIEQSVTANMLSNGENEAFAAQLFKLGKAYIEASEGFRSIDTFVYAVGILETLDANNYDPEVDTITKVKYYLNTLDSAWRHYVTNEVNVNTLRFYSIGARGQIKVDLSQAYFKAAFDYINSDVYLDERVEEYIAKGVKVLHKNQLSFAMPPLKELFKNHIESYALDYMPLLLKELPSAYTLELLEIAADTVAKEYGEGSPEHWNIKAHMADVYLSDKKLKNRAEKSLKLYTQALKVMLETDGPEFEYTTTLERICYRIYRYGAPWKTSTEEDFFEKLLDITRDNPYEQKKYIKHLKWYADWHYKHNRLVAAEPLYKEYIQKVVKQRPNIQYNPLKKLYGKEYAKKVYSKQDLENELTFLKGLYNIARIYRKTGRYQSSINTYERALTRLQDIPNDYLEIKVLNDLGLLYQHYETYESASVYFENALEKILDLDSTPKGRLKSKEGALLYIKTMRRIGRLALDLQNYAKASEYYQKIRDFEEESYFVSFYRDHSLKRDLALLYDQLGEFEKAERYYSLALRQIEGYTETVELIVSYADFYDRRQNDTLASSLYSKALEIDLQAIDMSYPNLSEEERLLFLQPINKRFNAFLDYVSKHPTDSALLTQGLNAHLTIKGLALENTNNIKDAIVNSENVQLNEWNNELQLLRKKMAKAATYSPEALVARNINIKKLAEDIKNLEKKLSRESKALRNAFDKQNKKLKYAQLQEILKPDEAAIDFWAIEQVDEYGDLVTNYYGVIIKKNQTVPTLVKLASELDIGYVLDNEVAPNTINYITDELESHYLYQLIWQPMLPHLDTIYSIKICPTGLLSKISFGTLLRYDNNRKRIMDKWELHYYSSLRDILRETTPSTSKKIALIGGVHFDLNKEQLIQIAKKRKLKEKARKKLLTPTLNTTYNTATEEFNYLPGTLREVQSIKSLFDVFDWNVTMLTGIDALEEDIDTLDLISPDILHIATHGFFFSANNDEEEGLLLEAGNKAFSVENTIASNKDPLLRSGLAMTGINMIWKNGKQVEGLEDGILFAKEVAGMNLFDTELVVLSACETGRGDIDNNEGIMGLQRAFKTAGAHKLIISLWKVPDQQTSELMQQFYNNYLTTSDVHFSFQEAQHYMQAKYKNPYYWAAFILIE